MFHISNIVKHRLHVCLGDGGGLHGGGGQGGVEVLLEGEGRHHAHVPDVEARVHEEEVAGHDQTCQRGRDQVGVGQGQEHPACKENNISNHSSRSETAKYPL